MNSNTNFTKSISLPPNNGDVSLTQIYVHFKPDSAIVYSRNILNYSSGADNVEVSISGTGILPVVTPNAPILSSPDSGAANQSVILKLKWNSSNGADKYSVQVSIDENFLNQIVDQDNLTSLEYQINSGTLSYKTKYFWRVKAENSAGTSIWSDIWLFTTEAEPLTKPDIPTLVSPSNSAVGQDLNLTLDWNDAARAASYNLLISDNSNFSDTVFYQSNISGSEYYVPQEKLNYNTKYYWQVNAVNNAGKSGWSSAWSFTTKDEELFTEMNFSLQGVDGGSVDWGDYDNDGDLDIVIAGNKDILPFTRIYRNDGNKFTPMTSIDITSVGNSCVKWGDYNNDGFLDLIITGSTGSASITKLYKNNGDGTFQEDTLANIIGVSYSSAAWGDYDNDGDLDLLITGDSGGNRISKVFSNNGDGSFTELSKESLTGISSGSGTWADYDNDGDLDILLCGATGDANNSRVCKIYKNNGDSTFTQQSQISLTGLSSNASMLAWGDYNNDGYLDILLSGHTGSERMAIIYKNNGNGTFTELDGLPFTAVNYSSVSWGDYNNDGYLDVLLTGYAKGPRITKVYKNNSDNTFSEVTGLSLTGVNYSSVTWVDYDNDGDLDILITGYDGTNKVTKIYRNNSKYKNNVPSTPSNLNSLVNSDLSITLTWDKSNDSETLQNGLSYNLMIGTSADIPDILSPMSDLSTGFRRVVRLGNAQTNSYTINGLPDGKYFWSVQAIDATYKGSLFAPEKSFNIITSVDDEFSSKFPTEYKLFNNYPNPFNPSTTISYQIPEASFINLKICNSIGQEIGLLVSTEKSAGRYTVNFIADNLSSGIYFYKLDAQSKISGKHFIKVGKMILLK